MLSNNKPIKVAIIDLYNGTANKAIMAFEKILKEYKIRHQPNLNWQVFNARQSNQLPDASFDIYISSGGPGSPFTEYEAWDQDYFRLINELFMHNASPGKQKKYVLFVCHSFQLMCRQYRLGEVSLRNLPSFGVVEVNFVEDGNKDPVCNALNNPFYAVDSRSWQVINPNEAALEKMGARVLAVERDRGDDLPRALMAIRFSEYFLGTQFHPEVGPDVMRERLLMDDNKQHIINEYGAAGYQRMLDELYNENKLVSTYNVIIPNFLNEAMQKLRTV